MEYANTQIRIVRKRRRKAAPVFGLWLFLLFSCLLATFFFLHSPYFAVQKIEVQGNLRLETEKILELSGLSTGLNIFKLNTNEAVQKIETHPLVKQVVTNRRLPNCILLEISERIPCAFVVGRDGLLAVDDEGIYLFAVSDPHNQQLPIISGINVAAEAMPGNQLKSAGLTSALEMIEMLDQVFLENVSEIIAATPESLTLRTRQGVIVRFGKPEDLERKVHLVQELLVKNGMIINDQTVEYIDLRYDTAPVIKRKNQ